VASTYMQRALTFKKPDGYNPYATGNKRYGPGGGPAPNAGPISNAQAAAGYARRDLETQARKQAVLEYLQSIGSGNYGSAGFLRGR
jgi:hypothetical protein